MPVAPVNSMYGKYSLPTFGAIHFKATFIGELEKCKHCCALRTNEE